MKRRLLVHGLYISSDTTMSALAGKEDEDREEGHGIIEGKRGFKRAKSL